MYPGQFKPSLSHRFIKSIEDHGKLLRNYTQNIDTLEQVVGLTNIIQCHGMVTQLVTRSTSLYYQSINQSVNQLVNILMAVALEALFSLSDSLLTILCGV